MLIDLTPQTRPTVRLKVKSVNLAIFFRGFCIGGLSLAASIGATATGLAGSTVGVSMGFGGSTTGAVVFTGGWLGAVALCIAAVAGETGVAAVGVAGVFSYARPYYYRLC